MQYKVILEGDVDTLASKVNELSKDGFKPIGGAFRTGAQFGQAVIKEQAGPELQTREQGRGQRR